EHALNTLLFCERKVFAGLPAQQIVPHFEAVLKKYPTLIRSSLRLMSVLPIYKRDPLAHRLLNRLFNENGWGDLLGRDRPAQWDRAKVGALLTQFEIGHIDRAQLQPIFDANPGARIVLLDRLPNLADKALLRYAISLLSDRTVVYPAGSENAAWTVSMSAQTVFERITKIEIKETLVNGLPQYDQDDIDRVHAFYGLSRN
ncbi:MAG: hypothetical protein V4671_11830, partial [Armatimonadota bacterium]